MAIANIAAALTQYNANLLWRQNGQASAILALEAVEYLIVNRAYQLGHVNSSLTFDTLTETQKKLEAFLNATNTTNKTSFTSARSRWS